MSEGRQSNSGASFKPVLSMSYDNEGDASEGVQYQSTDGALPQAALAQLPALLCCLLGLQGCSDLVPLTKWLCLTDNAGADSGTGNGRSEAKRSGGQQGGKKYVQHTAP